MNSFSGGDADAIWRAAVDCLRESGGAQGSRAGNTVELLHTVIEITDATQRWAYSRNPALSVAFAIVETIAILRGRRDAEFLTYWNRDLPRYVGNSSEMHGAYGYRLRFQFGVDQLEHAFLALQANSTSRQVVLSIWDPKADLPDSSGKPRAQDIPCNVCSMLKIRDGKLEWLQVMRSNDVFRGLPYNFVQFTTLQEVMAGWLGLELGAYVHVSDSLHVYESDLTAALGYKTPSETTRNRDSLALPKKESDAVWSRMASEVEELIHTSLSPERLVALATAREYPTAYANLMRVVVAEAYRRRGDDSSARAVVEDCTNAALQLLWRNWHDRMSS